MYQLRQSPERSGKTGREVIVAQLDRTQTRKPQEEDLRQRTGEPVEAEVEGDERG